MLQGIKKYGMQLLLAGCLTAIAAVPAFAAPKGGTGDTIMFDGSTTVYPIVYSSQTQYPLTDLGTGTTIQVWQENSSHGRTSVLNNYVDVGDASSACSPANNGSTGGTVTLGDEFVPSSGWDQGANSTYPSSGSHSPYFCPGAPATTDPGGNSGNELTTMNAGTSNEIARDAVTLIVSKAFLATCSGVPTSPAVGASGSYLGQSGGFPVLSFTQVQQIWEGVYTNWNQVYSCPSTPIVLLSRAQGSGTRSSFLKLAKIYCGPSTGSGADVDAVNGNCATSPVSGGESVDAAVSASGMILQTNPQVEQQVDTDGTKGDMGYIGLAFTDSNNTQFAIVPSGGSTAEDPVKNNLLPSIVYPYGRLLYMYMNPVSAARSVVQNFDTFISTGGLGEQGQGQGLVNEFGFVAVGPEQCPNWDVNCDGVDNIEDLGQVGQYWQQHGPASSDPASTYQRGWVRADAAFVGVVDIRALTTIGQNWQLTW
jgi:ABC-type phosphate transport system substrate-binding protein